MTQVAVPSDKPPIRRILSIDGGGIMGTQPASFLTSLEEDLDRPIGEYFDLIAGTSTGGILAIGLAFPRVISLTSMSVAAHTFLDSRAALWRASPATRGVASSTSSPRSMTLICCGANSLQFSAAGALGMRERDW